MPYPCCAPIASSVFRIIRDRVPCHTSVLGLICESHRRLPHLVWEYNRSGRSTVAARLSWDELRRRGSVKSETRLETLLERGGRRSARKFLASARSEETLHEG